MNLIDVISVNPNQPGMNEWDKKYAEEILAEHLINIGNTENYELNLFELPSDVMHSDVMKVIVESLNPDCDYPIPPIPFSD